MNTKKEDSEEIKRPQAQIWSMQPYNYIYIAIMHEFIMNLQKNIYRYSQTCVLWTT